MFEKVVKYKELLLYLIFGGLTTLVNIVIFYLFNNILDIHYQVSNIIAWIIAVTFAYISNRIVVFESRDSNLINEGVKFYLFRVASLVIDLITMYVLIDLFNINDLVSKIIVNIIVVIVNYIFSKKFIFKKN